jgi:hypothetical protein
VPLDDDGRPRDGAARNRDAAMTAPPPSTPAVLVCLRNAGHGQTHHDARYCDFRERHGTSPGNKRYWQAVNCWRNYVTSDIGKLSDDTELPVLYRFDRVNQHQDVERQVIANHERERGLGGHQGTKEHDDATKSN